MKNELNRIRLFLRNVRMILAVDPLHKVIFSFSCAKLDEADYSGGFSRFYHLLMYRIADLER